MDLIVNVKETSTGNIILGGGYGSYDGFLITAGIKDQNVFGSGKAVGVKVDYSSHKQDIDLFLKEPSINDSKYNGSINIYSKTREIEYSSPDYSFEKKTIGFAIGAGTEIFRNTFAGLVYKLETIEETYNDESTTDSYNPFDYKTNEDYILSSLKPYISYDSTDDHNFPRNGTKASTSLEFAGIGGDAKFTKSYSRYKYFHSLKKEYELSSHVELEITERGIDPKKMNEFSYLIKKLHKHGIRISLDDFGTGQAGLSYINSLSFDKIKIDKKFVDAIGTDSVDFNILTTIIELAKKLDVLIVAEGIETERQRKWLLEQGVTVGQGWLFSKALSHADFLEGLVLSKR